MGIIATPIPFFDQDITIVPDMISIENAEYLDHPTTIETFAKGEPCSLVSLDNGSLMCETYHSKRFMAGPELKEASDIL